MAKPLQHQILSRALELISDQRSWTQGAMARTASGNPCVVTHNGAVRFCAIGAVHRAVIELTGALDQRLANAAVRRVSSYLALPYINDMGGRRRVVELFKKALDQFNSGPSS